MAESAGDAMLRCAKELEAEASTIAASIVRGNLADYPSYREKCAVVKAKSDAAGLIREAHAKVFSHEDDD